MVHQGPLKNIFFSIFFFFLSFFVSLFKTLSFISCCLTLKLDIIFLFGKLQNVFCLCFLKAIKDEEFDIKPKHKTILCLSSRKHSMKEFFSSLVSSLSYHICFFLGGGRGGPGGVNFFVPLHPISHKSCTCQSRVQSFRTKMIELFCSKLLKERKNYLFKKNSSN